MSGNVDFIEEIRIAQFWRKQLGEYEYVYYNPDDLRRWYIALETRGPTEIRDYLIERTGRYPDGQVTGIVATAPHPPRAIIELWLASYDKAHTRGYLFAGIAFLVFCYYGMTTLSGINHVRPMTALQMNPPQTGGAPPQVGTTALPQSGATLPASLPAPATAASHPSSSSSSSSSSSGAQP